MSMSASHPTISCSLKKKLATGQAGQDADLKTEVKVVLDDGSEYAETGLLEFSDVTVDQSTGTVTIRAIVANPRQELLPGMFVRARLTSAGQQTAILVPQASIVRNNRGQAMVMLVNDKSMVEARPVETGQNLGEQIVISKGLAAGDQPDRRRSAENQTGCAGEGCCQAACRPRPQAAPAEQTPAKKAE